MYQYYLFDLDGTLTDPKEGITKCVQYALQKEGYGAPALEELLCFIGPPLHLQFEKFCHVTPEEGKHLVDVYRERFATIGLFENRVFDGIVPMLEKLKKMGKHLAVATSKPTVFTNRILERYKLDQYFDVVVGANLDGTQSVKAEIIEEVLRQFSLSETDKKHCLMIGDRKHDIIGAQTVGMDSLGVLFGYSEPDELKQANATYIVSDIKELTAFLCSH